MKSINKNLVYFALIFALILAFCGALLLSVFVGEKVAFADNYGSVYNFNQYVYNGDFSSSNYWSPVKGSLSVSNGIAFYTVTENSGSANGNRLQSTFNLNFIAGHTYAYIFSCRSDTNASMKVFCGTPEIALFFSTSSSFQDFFLTFTPSISFEDKFYLSVRSNVTSTPIGWSFNLTNVMFVDLTILGRPDISSYSEWHTLFPSSYYQRTTGTLVSPSYNQGYNDGLLVGYNDGFSSAVDTFSDYNFVVQSDMFENLSDTSSIYSLIEGSYYTFSKITSVNSTTSISEVGLNVGWKDIFATDDWNILSLSNVGFSWRIGTVSKSTNGLVYSTFNFVSSEPRFLPNNVLQLGASDPNSSRSYIQIDLEEHSCTITVPCFLSSYTTSDSVPNLYPSYQLTPLTFTMDSNLANSFLDGYNNGYGVATSTVIDTSASWSAGYNAGVSSAQNTTFDSLMSAVIDVPIKTIGGLLDFNFLGINLLQFIYSLLTLGIIIAIIRLCLGKS